jgi:flagella basal body P-ring formation protein FlgA
MRLVSFIVIVTAMGLAAVAHAEAVPAQTVTTERLVEAARKALPVAGTGVAVTVHVLGIPPDATVPAGPVRLQTHAVVGRWPRARVAIPVVVLVNDKPVRSETVWFAVSALRSAWVYAQAAPAGTAMSQLKVHKATVDIAKANGQPIDALAAVTGDRLRRGVQSGWPLLKGDFEPVPDVDKQSQVVVHVRYGSIRMETLGKALGTGEIGDVVSVLVEGAASPVSAKVTGKGVVDIAR